MSTLEIEDIGVASALAAAPGAHVLHSWHLNAALLRVLYEADGIDAAAILRDAGAAAAQHLPLPPPASSREARLRHLAATIAGAGLGRVDFSRLNEALEGEIRLHGSHFARAWTERFRSAAKPVCAATGGIIGALLSRSEGAAVELRETACAARGASSCAFRVDEVQESPAGTAARSRSLGAERPESGALPEGPGAPFTWLPAAFHVGLASAFEREVPLRRGAKFGNLPGILLLEAAHRGSYHLFGELLATEPLQGLDVELRLTALVHRIDELGWGSWQVTTYLPGERLIVQIADSAEAEAYLAAEGRASSPRCHLARGAAAAAMNLLFRRHSPRDPFNDADYNRVFRSPASFRAVETRCRGMGDSLCEIVANPLTL